MSSAASCLQGGPGTCHFPTLPTLVTKATKTRALQAELKRHPVPAVPFCHLRPDTAHPPDAIPTPIRAGIQVILSSHTTAEFFNVSSILFGHTGMGSPSKPVEKRKSHVLFYYILQSTELKAVNVVNCIHFINILIGTFPQITVELQIRL